MGKTMCFSGYRPNRLGGFSGERAMLIQGGVKRKAIEVIKRAHRNGFDRFISGGAIGVDQIVADAVLEVRNAGYLVSLVMAIPFPSQGCKWPPHVQEKYKRLIAQAQEVIYCDEDPYSARKMHKRNEWMADESDATAAFWAGDPGGTAGFVRYVRSKKIPVLIINPYTLHEKWER